MNQQFEYLKPKLLSSRVYPEFFEMDASDRVVNLGCGNGPQAIIYRGQFAEMIGVDVNQERLANSDRAVQHFNVQNFRTICANVENTPLADASFDKALAIDIIEHVESPRQLCLEANRLLRPGGKMLITFPAMHDKFSHFASNAKRVVLRKGSHHEHSDEWNPDNHNSEYPLNQWIDIVEGSGFELSESRASTLFPPLHLYGVPKFWFSNDLVHKVDSYFCNIPVVKNYGQALVCVFTKVD